MRVAVAFCGLRPELAGDRHDRLGPRVIDFDLLVDEPPAFVEGVGVIILSQLVEKLGLVLLNLHIHQRGENPC
ncbi:MAG: hypothetical protein V3T70_09200, partial [Phycisphaerae bacterium]